MKAKIIVAVASAALVTGCGAAASGHRADRVSPVANAVPAVPAMSHLESVQDCAALDLIRTGAGSYAQEVQTVAGESAVTQHVAAVMIARNVRASCPQEISVLP